MTSQQRKTPSRFDDVQSKRIRRRQRGRRDVAARVNRSLTDGAQALEERRLLAADPIQVGVVYLETDYLETDNDVGSDSQPDRFILSFVGGAADTELATLRIRTDKDADGISVGDPIFDTAEGGRGKNGYHGFNVVRVDAGGRDVTATATVEDGGQELLLRLTGFRAGDRLEFTLDVDEVLRNAADLAIFNDRLDVITSGQEFQDSILEATFDAPDYFSSQTSALFVNDFGDPASVLGLDLPADEGQDLDSRPNRSAAAVGSVTQQPMPSSVRGFVYVDINNDGVRDVNELGIGGVAIELIPTGSGSATSTLSVITSADGSYAFEDIPAGTYTLRQPIQPSAYEDGLETAGTVDSVIVGIANNPGDSISDVTLMPNDHGIEFNFGELPLGRLSGHVYLAPPGEDCSGRHSGSIALQDVSVELRDASGALLRSTRTNADGQYSFENLPAGEYQIVEYTPQGLLDGASQVGEIAGTDGLIRLVGVAVGGERIRDVNLTPGGRGVNYDFCEAAPAQISGNVYVDRNNDGIRQISETPLGGVLLTLVDASGNTVTTTNSADDGTYQFTSLLPGDYQIIQQQPDGFFDGRDTAGTIAGQTVGSAENPGDIIRQISIRQGQTGVDYDFGELLPSSISGRVFVDTNQDCVFDANERGLAGVSVDLLDARGNVVATTTTDAAGDYRFDDLRPGRYTLRQQQPDGMLHGGQRAGDGGGDDSVDDLISNVDVGPGQDLIEYDFCEVPPGSIAGLVFVDTDGDCVVDADEMGLGGVIVELLDTDGTVVNRTTTSADGTYVFDNLRPGRYSVREIQPEDFFHGGQRAGNGGGDDSQQDLIADVDVVPGAQLQNYDFCEIPPASIRGMVFVDSNGDCIVQQNEPGLEGVTVELIDDGGNVVASTITSADGSYKFLGLRPGEYAIRETQPDGYFHGGQRAGDAGGDDSVADLISSINVTAGDNLLQYDFCEIPPASIAGLVFVDSNGDCVRQTDEAGLAGVTVDLIDGDGNVVATTITGSNGTYQFENLRPGEYSVRETQPFAVFHGGQRSGSGGGDDSTPDLISSITVGPGEQLTDYDFCEVPGGEISGRVWEDPDLDRVYDDDETPLAGVTVSLVSDDGTQWQTETDAKGRYRFESLPPGMYTVIQQQPDGYFHGGEVIGSLGGETDGQDRIVDIKINGGDRGQNYDFPEVPPATISGYIYQDGPALRLAAAPPASELRRYRDGLRTSDDTPIDRVLVELRNVLGQRFSSDRALPGIYEGPQIRTTSGPDGYYEFTGLRPGTYHIYQAQPEGFVDGLDTPGSTGGIADNPADRLMDDPAQFIIQTLSANADTAPGEDAILNVQLAPGQRSLENNFSEIIVSPLPPPPEPPQEIPPGNPPAPSPSIAPLPPVLLVSSVPRDNFRPVLGRLYSEPVTWHLSVVNGGFPRGGSDADQQGASVLQVSGAVRTHRDKVDFDPRPHNKGKWQVFDAQGNRLESSESFKLGHWRAIPLTGDFNGDGISDLAVFDEGIWFVDLNGNGQWDQQDLWLQLGRATDRPVVGDWDGDGKDDIGIFGRQWAGDPRAIDREPGLPDPYNLSHRPRRPKNLPPTEDQATDGHRYLRRTSDGDLQRDLIDHVFRYGDDGDTPLAGDWNGDGIDTIAIYNGGRWRLDSNGDGRMGERDTTHAYGQPGDQPVVGDWDGDGTDDIGIVRGDEWIMDTDGDGKLTGNDRRIQIPRDTNQTPVVGDWDGDGTEEPGYYRDAG